MTMKRGRSRCAHRRVSGNATASSMRRLSAARASDGTTHEDMTLVHTIEMSFWITQVTSPGAFVSEALAAETLGGIVGP
jgi:hypothetical protein